MSSAKTKTPQIPAIPKDVSPSIRRWMESVKEIVEVREGFRGQELDKSVTFRDLLDINVDITGLNINGAPLKQPSDDDDRYGDTDPTNVPPWTPQPGDIDPLPYCNPMPTPTNLKADGGVGIVWLSWDNPQTMCKNYRLAEIYRGISENPNGRELIGTSPSGRYIDRLHDAGDTEFYYWVRFLSTDDVYGHYAGPVTGANIYAVLSQQIKKTFLDSFLHTEIELISAAKTVPGSVSARIEKSAGETKTAAVEEVQVTYIGSTNKSVTEFISAVFGEDSAVKPVEGVTLAARVEQVKTTADGNTTSVTELSGSIDGVKGVYGVKIDTTTRGGKHYMSGFGLIQNLEKDENGDYTGEVESSFIVDVKKFAIIDSSKYQDSHDPVDIQTPFMVGTVNNKSTVIIKNAAIGDATITSAKIYNLEASKIDTGHINVNTSITLGGDVNDPNKHRYMELKSFEVSGSQNANLTVYDENGKARVVVGRSTSALYGADGFGLYVWDSKGNPQFDANGARVKIDDAFISDLWAGGLKVTVPKSSFTAAQTTLPSDSQETVTQQIQQLDYDPQGSNNLSVMFDVGYDFDGDFVEVDPGGGNMPAYGGVVGVTLYGPNYDNDHSGARNLGSWVMFRGSATFYTETAQDEGGETHYYSGPSSQSGTCSGSVLITGYKAKYVGRYRLVAWATKDTGGYSSRVIFNRNLTAIGMR